MLRDHGFEKLVDGHVGFRRVIAGSVLATDMGRHFPIVEELKALASRWNDENARPSPYEPTLEDTVLITAALLKCGDISNSVCLLDTFPYISPAWLTRFVIA